MYKKVNQCRICGNDQLERILALGNQMLTGVFLRSDEDKSKVTVGPLSLVKCMGKDSCGLVQLEHSFDLLEMYGDNYGYRSGLNKSMVNHLHAKVAKIQSLLQLSFGDLIIDIGGNDSTTLQAYPKIGLDLISIDPTAEKFREFYPKHIQLIPDFFSSSLVKNKFGSKKAKVVTSFSMFYDLEKPVDFMREVHEILADDGVWVFEQSYMPTMLATNSFDTICHEHLEFYALKQIHFMANLVGFVIEDIEFNDINGGSFSVMVRKQTGQLPHNPIVDQILRNETLAGFDGLEPFLQFQARVEKSKNELVNFVRSAKSQGKTISALGASTKGNVLLQYCGLTKDDIDYVGEVNPEKFGRVTPGTFIPIIPEDELLRMQPDYLLVLPWHFRSFFITNPKYTGHKLVFPLPSIEIFG
jgi:NDP-4-keto-2,6-dideoxyhexose 3-C-methyltransferase